MIGDIDVRRPDGTILTTLGGAAVRVARDVVLDASALQGRTWRAAWPGEAGPEARVEGGRLELAVPARSAVVLVAG